MGYFANLYVVQAEANDTAVKTRTTIYGNDIGPVAYFCWGSGDRPGGLHPYADGTVLCDTQLRLLPGYPLDQICEDPDRCLIEADFRPQHANDPVIFHFILPKKFIPRRDMKPLEQPMRPFIYSVDERVVATYPAVGPAIIRFWITRLGEKETIADYELYKLFHPDEERPSKIGFEFNLGVFKLKYG